jgi:hypothetical protein
MRLRALKRSSTVVVTLAAVPGTNAMVDVAARQVPVEAVKTVGRNPNTKRRSYVTMHSSAMSFLCRKQELLAFAITVVRTFVARSLDCNCVTNKSYWLCYYCGANIWSAFAQL